MADEDKPLWELSRAEQRLLQITFAGGLASILVGAAMIGLSIALARWDLARLHHKLIDLVVATAVLAFPAAYGLRPSLLSAAAGPAWVKLVIALMVLCVLLVILE